MLTLYLLGAPQITLDGLELHLARRKSRAILYYLAAQAEAVTREGLLSLFWPDLPRPAARQTLRTTLHGLKQVLGEAILVQGERLALDENVWVDVNEFTGQLGGPNLSEEQLTAALALYRGEFLQDFSLPETQAFEDWLLVERQRYFRLAVRGLEALSAAQQARQDYHAALDSLERALAFDPLQEDLQREAIRLHYLAGDRPAAIRRYDELRRLLDEQMGVPPMVETRALYDAILNDRLASSPAVVRLAPTANRSLARSPERHAQVAARPARAGDLPFAGRQAELVALQAARPGPRLVLVEGEPGIGKTRLVEEHLGASGHLPLVGRGRELEQSLPYHPFIEALRGLLALPGWPEWHAALRIHLPALWWGEISRLLPELGGTGGDLPAAPRPAEESRLWEGVRQFLASLASIVHPQPIAVFLDDLHWVDTASLNLLGYLVRQPLPHDAIWISASRPPVARSPLATFLQALTREDRLQRLALARLGREDVELLARQLASTGAQPLAEWLWYSSEGNPFVLSELARHARQNGLLQAGSFSTEALSAGPVVPQTVYSLIQARLYGLSDAARRVLDAAVAQGREFEFSVVMRAAGLSEGAALDALDELLAAGLVRPTQDAAPGCYAFDHPLTLEVAHREVGELRHRRLHRLIAEALEGLYPDRLETLAGQLAWHFAEGDALLRAAPYARQAGEQAARLAAWNEAIAFYGLALKGLSGAPRLPVLVALADAQVKAGHFPQASEILRGALAEAQALADPGSYLQIIQLALARSLMPQARFTEVIEVAQGVCGSGDPNSVITAELLWGTALASEGADLEAAADHLNTAAELWNEHPAGDLATLAQIRFEMGNVAAQQGDLPRAVASYHLALEAASAAQSDFAIDQRVLALNNLAYHLHLMGDPSAIEYARAGLALAEEKGIMGMQTYLYSTLGEIALAAGDLQSAERFFSRGLSLAERFSVAERAAGLTANLGLLAAQRGETSLALYRLSTALGQVDALGTRHLAAQVRIWLAPLLPEAEARQRLGEAREIAEHSGRKGLLAQIDQLEKR